MTYKVFHIDLITSAFFIIKTSLLFIKFIITYILKIFLVNYDYNMLKWEKSKFLKK